MCAVYAFARRIDDIGDGTLLAPSASCACSTQAAEQLARARRHRHGAHARRATRCIVALADAYRALRAAARRARRADRRRAHGRRRRDVRALRRARRLLPPRRRRDRARLPGDLRPARAAPRGERAQAEGLADDLGVALQLTNILRDVREDAENGRVYLPAEDLRRFGVLPAPRAGAAGDDAGAPGAAARRPTARPSGRRRWPRLVRFEAEPRAASGSTAASRSCRCSTAAARACVLAMTGIYRRLLERIEADPRRRCAARVSLPAAREGVGGAARACREAARERRDGSSWSAAAWPGITAALDCAEAGADVTLVEVRPPARRGRLLRSSATACDIDNGQHVFLRCCIGLPRRCSRAWAQSATCACRRAWRSRC